jgi:hypothetical protein
MLCFPLIVMSNPTVVFDPFAADHRDIVQAIGRISDLLNFLLVYFSFLWNKELHVAAGDLSGT